MRLIIIFLFLLPLKLIAQDITGVWTGTIYNDTTQKYIPYEIAISESKGKLVGFSHSTFVEEDGKKIAVKSIKIKNKDDKYFVEDEEWLYKNFPEPAPKGVKQHSALTLAIHDSEMVLTGPFNTNRTKEYLSNTGTIRLTRKKNYKQTEIIPKLEELKLSADLSFIRSETNSDIAIAKAEERSVAINKPKENIAADVKKQPEEIKEKVIAASLPKEEKKLPVTVAKENIPDDIPEPVLKRETSKIPITKVSEQQIATKQQVKKAELVLPIVKQIDVAASLPKEEKKLPAAIPQPKEKMQQALNNQDYQIKKLDPVSQQKVEKRQVVISAPKEEKKLPAVIPQPKEKMQQALNNQDNQIKKSEPVSQQKIEKKPVVISVPKEEKKLPAVIPQPKEKMQQALNNQDNQIKKSDPVFQQKIEKKPVVISAPKEEKKLPAVISQPKEKETQQVASVPKPAPKPVSTAASVVSAEDLSKRKIETIKSVYFKTDSLTITLYDNGEVDGDTVSVILNGKVIMPKVGLNTTAIKKTIYITPDMGDSLQLIMYAENLGSIPPNTGLLILQDGDDRYEIRFAGDLQKNSAIILRRRNSNHQ